MAVEMAATRRTPRAQPAQEADDDLRLLRSKLHGVLSRRPDIERRVVELRMGLVDGRPAKPGETAERLGLTITEVKRIEERAFARIREVVPIKRLERFL
jgi:RNA polymerase primary sigma factor